MRRLQKDPKSFEPLAQTRSRAPEASTGGLMGTFAARRAAGGAGGRGLRARRGRRPATWCRARLGYHVLRVDDARGRAPARPSASAGTRSAPQLLRQKSDTSVREFVQGLMARAKVNHEAANGTRPS